MIKSKNNRFRKSKISLYVYIVVGVLIILAGVGSYFISLPDKYANNIDIAKERCTEQCIKAQGLGRDLSEGPCLSNEIVEGWVCDVVHSPRVSLIDDKAQNQCSAYSEHKATHFVEVSPLCKIVRAV